MLDATAAKSALESVIEELDPVRFEVAVAHLKDAVAALEAVAHDEPTNYTRSGRVVNGRVLDKNRNIKLFK